MTIVRVEDDTFCIYCQRDFASHGNLVRHIDLKHKHTYAWCSYVGK